MSQTQPTTSGRMGTGDLVAAVVGKHHRISDDFLHLGGTSDPLARVYGEVLLQFQAVIRSGAEGGWISRPAIGADGVGEENWFWTWACVEDVVGGVFWESSDSYGRHFICSVCLAGRGLSTTDFEDHFRPAIEEAAVAVQAAHRKGQVLEALERLERICLAGRPRGSADMPGCGARRTRAYLEELGIDPHGAEAGQCLRWVRIHLAGFGRHGGSSGRTDTVDRFPSIRFPARLGACCPWVDVLRGQLRRDVSVLVVQRCDAAHADYFPGRLPDNEGGPWAFRAADFSSPKRWLEALGNGSEGSLPAKIRELAQSVVREGNEIGSSGPSIDLLGNLLARRLNALCRGEWGAELAHGLEAALPEVDRAAHAKEISDGVPEWVARIVLRRNRLLLSRLFPGEVVPPILHGLSCIQWPTADGPEKRGLPLFGVPSVGEPQVHDADLDALWDAAETQPEARTSREREDVETRTAGSAGSAGTGSRGLGEAIASGREDMGRAASTRGARGDSPDTRPPTRSRSGFPPWLAVLALMSLALGVWLLARKGDDAGPGPTVPESSLREEWLAYAEDYRTWYGPLVEAAQAGTLGSLYLRTNLAVVLRSSRERSLSPLSLLETDDPLNVSLPDLRVLKRRESQIKAALEALNTIRGSALPAYPQFLRQEAAALAGTPMGAAASNLVAGMAPSDLPEVAGQSANRVGGPSGGDVMGGWLKAAAQVETALRRMRVLWSEWTGLPQLVPSAQSNVVTRLMAAAEDRWRRMNDADQALTDLGTVLSDFRTFALWLRERSPNVHQASFAQSLSAESTSTLASLSNLVVAHTLTIVGREDPREALGRWRKESDLGQRLEDLSAVVGSPRAGNEKVSQVLSRAGELDSRLASLQELLGIEVNRSLIDGKARELEKDYRGLEAQVGEAWSQHYSGERLLGQFLSTPTGHSVSQAYWRAYLNEFGRKVQDASPSELKRWRAVLLDGHTFVTGLATNELARPPLPAALEPGLVDGLRAELLARCADTNRSPGGEWRLPLDDFLASEVGRSLLAQFRSIGLAFEALDQREKALWSPTNAANAFLLEPWIADYAVVRSAGPMRALVGHSTYERVREFGERYWVSVAPARGDLWEGAATNRLGMVMAMARLGSEAVADSPDFWPRVMRWARLAREALAKDHPEFVALRPGAPLDAWLGRMWRKLAQRGGNFQDIRHLLELTRAAGMERAPSLAGLSYNGQLSELFDLCDQRQYTLLVSRARGLLAAPVTPPLAEPHRSVLEKLSRIEIAADDFGRTAWDGLGPVRAGFQASRKGSNVLELVGYGLRLPFRLVETKGSARAFVGIRPILADEVPRLMAIPDTNKVVLNTWLDSQEELVKAAPSELRKGAFVWDAPVSSLNNLTGVTNSKGQLVGLTRRLRRFPVGTGTAEPSVLLVPYDVVGADAPANHLSASTSAGLARLAGCRLLSAREWAAVVSAGDRGAHPLDPGPGAGELLRELEKQMKVKARSLDVLVHAGTNSLPLLLGIPSNGGGESGDRWTVWPPGGWEHARNGGEAVLVGSRGPFQPSEKSPEVDVVPNPSASRGYANVGFRLAFDWMANRAEEQIAGILNDLSPDWTR